MKFNFANINYPNEQILRQIFCSVCKLHFHIKSTQNLIPHFISSLLHCAKYYLVSTRYVFKAAPIVGPAVRSYLIDKAISMTFRVFNTTRPKKVVAAETVALASS